MGASRTLLNRAALTVAAGALVLSVAAPAGASQADPVAAPAGKVKVNTFGEWDGESNLFPFGNPDTATYGQTFTSPSKPSELKKFVFDIAGGVGDVPGTSVGPIVFQGEVYRWDGKKAIGPSLWQSSIRSRTFRTDEYREVEFITAGTEPKLDPDTQYVVFCSVSTTYEESAPDTFAEWAFVPGSDPYAGGHAVTLSNGGDESQWTKVPWTSLGAADFVTKINMKTTG